MLLLSHLGQIHYGISSGFLDRKTFSLCFFLFLLQGRGGCPCRDPSGGQSRTPGPEELASWEGSHLMCRRQNVTLTLPGEPAGRRDQCAASRPRPQGAPCSPLSARERLEAVLQEAASRGVKTQRFAPREPLGMLTAQDLKGSSVLTSSRILVGVNVTL